MFKPSPIFLKIFKRFFSLFLASLSSLFSVCVILGFVLVPTFFPRENKFFIPPPSSFAVPPNNFPANLKGAETSLTALIAGSISSALSVFNSPKPFLTLSAIFDNNPVRLALLASSEPSLFFAKNLPLASRPLEFLFSLIFAFCAVVLLLLVLLETNRPRASRWRFCGVFITLLLERLLLSLRLLILFVLFVTAFVEIVVS